MVDEMAQRRSSLAVNALGFESSASKQKQWLLKQLFIERNVQPRISSNFPLISSIVGRFQFQASPITIPVNPKSLSCYIIKTSGVLELQSELRVEGQSILASTLVS